MRAAIYFTPHRDDPLTRRAADWLGRDAFGGAVHPLPSIGLSPAELSFHTAAARRYGFHATLKAPFRLIEGQTLDALERAAAAFVRTMQPVIVPRLAVERIDGFFALVPERPLAELERFADDVVIAFERFRAPLSEAEIGRRGPENLTPVEVRNLLQWGYPYVFESFRFHMTLSGRVGHAEAPRLRQVIEAAFSPLLARPVPVDGIAVFVEPEPGAPFHVHSYHRLGEGRQRRTA